MEVVTITELTDQDFEARVLEPDRPVLVEFYASWCGNCRRIAPLLDRLASELADHIEIVKVDAETNPELVATYGVTSTPTLILFDDGVRGTLVGAQPEQRIREFIEQGLDTEPPTNGLAWIPADACQLPDADQPLRLAAFEDLFATDVHAVERVEPTRLRLALSSTPEVASRAAELATRESDCCGFFSFTLTAAQDELSLEVSVPQSRTEVLDGMATQAAGAAT